MKGSQESLTTVVVKDAANWPTPAVMDTTGGSYKTEWIDGRAVSYHNHKEENPVAYGAKLSDAVKHGQAAPANHNTHGSRQELWPTITAHTPDMESSGPNGHSGTYLAGAVKQEQESWPTPSADGDSRPGANADPVKWKQIADAKKAQGINKQLFLTTKVAMEEQEKMWRTPSVAEEKNQNTSTQIYLQNQVGATPKAWATPRDQDHKHSLPTEYEMQSRMHNQLLHMQTGGKLNPRWVETLMGLPVGWVMPSCKSPVTIEQTNCDSSATESCLPQPSELFAF
jgi:hypothetical protein